MTLKERVRDALNAQGRAREPAMDALCRAVKACDNGDDDAELTPVEEALPTLAQALLSEEGTIAGCAISIFRRVRVSAETLSTLLTLQRATPNPLLVEAIGHIDRALFSDEVETTLRRALRDPNTAFAATRALYFKEDTIGDVETVHALTEAREHGWRVNEGAVLVLTRIANGHAFSAVAKEALDL